MASDPALADTVSFDDILAPPADERETTRKPSFWIAFGVGIVASALMLVPMWVTGIRLPLQNLWGTDTMPDDMPVALLALSQYEVFAIFAMVLLGGVVAGLGVRMLRRWRPMRAWAAALGVLLVHLVVTVQSFAVLGDGLGVSDGTAGTLQLMYFAGMLAAVVLGILLAQLGVLLTTRRSSAFAALAVALSAVWIGQWLGSVIGAIWGIAGPPVFLFDVLRWVPAVTVGVALVWCGVRPWGRIFVWIAGLLALWVLPAAITAVAYPLGTRAFGGDVREMSAAAAQIFPQALEIGVPAVVVAAVIGVVGTAVRMLLARRSTD